MAGRTDMLFLHGQKPNVHVLDGPNSSQLVKLLLMQDLLPRSHFCRYKRLDSLDCPSIQAESLMADSQSFGRSRASRRWLDRPVL